MHPAGTQNQRQHREELQEPDDHAREDIEPRAADHQRDRVDEDDPQDAPEGRVILRAVLDEVGNDQAGEEKQEARGGYAVEYGSHDQKIGHQRQKIEGRKLKLSLYALVNKVAPDD